MPLEMTPRILLIGKNGQVGSELIRFFSPSQLTPLGRHELDLTRPTDIRHTIEEVRPSVIINAAAYTAVDRAEEEEALARAINADAPGVIAAEAKRIGALLVHYSTDYVFDGSKGSPYNEDDATGPVSAYGRSKLAGEEAIRAIGAPHLIFRTAWVYATSGKNFPLTILRLAANRDELRIVSDQRGAPTWSREIAAATARVLKQRVEPYTAEAIAKLADLSGTYHLTAAGETTWHEFGVAILERCSQIQPQTAWLASATNGLPLKAKRVIPITTADYPTPASRPAYSILSNKRFARTFGFSMPDWLVQLSRALASEPQNNRRERSSTDSPAAKG